MDQLMEPTHVEEVKEPTKLPPIVTDPGVEEPLFAPPTPPPTPPPPEPSDNAERSQLGRRVKGMEDRFGELQRTLEALNQSISTLGRSSVPPPPPSYAPPAPSLLESADPEYITTPADLERYLAKREGKKMAAERAMAERYQQGFLHSIDMLGRTPGADQALHQEVVGEMLKDSQFTARVTGNPMVDSRLHYASAMNVVLGRKLKATPVGGPPAGMPEATPFGLQSGGRSENPSMPAIVLDKESADFVRRTGMKEQSVRDALASTYGPSEKPGAPGR